MPGSSGRPGRRQRGRPAPASSSHPTDVAGRTLNGIHAELSARLEAYGVFLPKPNYAFDLFQVLYIHCDSTPRHKSPEVTTANLKTICEVMKEDLEDGYDENPGLDKATLIKLCKQMDQTKTEITDSGTKYSVVTESSLETSWGAGASVSAAEMFSAGFDVSREKVATRAISVAVTESHKCTRVNELRKLIWRNGEILFNKILEDLDTDLDMGNDDRKLIAIVTQKIVADVNISRERTFSTTVGMHGGGPEETVNGRFDVNTSTLERDSSVVEGGIAGIQFILFPVVRLGDYKFRVFPGLNVGKVDDDDLDGLGASPFSKYKRWCQPKQKDDDPEDNFNGKYHDVPFNTYHKHCGRDDYLQKRARSAPNSEINGIPNTGAFRDIGSKDDLNDPDWIDVAPRFRSHRIPFIDVDLAPSLTDFTMRQCALAARYRAQADSNAGQDEGSLSARTTQRAKSVSLLRSALRKCCYESTVRALFDLADCYHSGIGISQDADTATGVRQCARVLGQVHESRRIWCQLLSNKGSFLREPEPERRILLITSISGPLPRLHLCLLSDTDDAIRRCDGVELSPPIFPQERVAVDSLGSTYFGETIGEEMLKYVVRKLFRITRSKASKKQQEGTGMQLIQSAFEWFERIFPLQQHERAGDCGTSERPKQQPPSRIPSPTSVIPGTVQQHERAGDRGTSEGPKQQPPSPKSVIHGTVTSSKAFRMVVVVFTLTEKRTVTLLLTPSEKTLRRTLEGEDSRTRSIPRALFIPGVAVDTSLAVGSPPRSCRPTEAQQITPQSAPSVENKGIPDAVDPRRVQSISPSDFEAPMGVPVFPGLPESVAYVRSYR